MSGGGSVRFRGRGRGRGRGQGRGDAVREKGEYLCVCVFLQQSRNERMVLGGCSGAGVESDNP